MTDTVTQTRQFESKGGMGVVGWLIFLGMVVLMIPLLPLYLLLLLYETIAGDDEYP